MQISKHHKRLLSDGDEQRGGQNGMTQQQTKIAIGMLRFGGWSDTIEGFFVDRRII